MSEQFTGACERRKAGGNASPTLVLVETTSPGEGRDRVKESMQSKASAQLLYTFRRIVGKAYMSFELSGKRVAISRCYKAWSIDGMLARLLYSLLPFASVKRAPQRSARQAWIKNEDREQLLRACGSNAHGTNRITQRCR
jgi:hypothetical protein